MRPSRLTTSNRTFREFNELVNMNAEELAEWLKGDASIGSGWKKDDGSGETVGHDRQGNPALDLQQRADEA